MTEAQKGKHSKPGAGKSENGWLLNGTTDAVAVEKGPKNLKPLWITLCVIAGVLLIAYIAGVIYFSQHFGFNTVVNDADVSFKNVSQVQEVVKGQVVDYQLAIVERDGNTDKDGAASTKTSTSTSTTGTSTTGTSATSTTSGTTTASDTATTTATTGTSTTGTSTTSGTSSTGTSTTSGTTASSSSSTSGGATEYISGSDIDLEYVEDGQVQTLLDEQNPWSWFTRIFKKSQGSELHATVTYDNDKLQKEIDALNCMDTTKMQAPVNAYPELSNGTFIAHHESIGTTLDTTATETAIADAITNTKEELDLSTAGVYTEPTVYYDNANLANTIALYNQYAQLSITYTFDDKNEVLDASTIVTWLKTADDGTASIDQDAISAWVADFASRHDTVGATRTFVGGDGATYTVSGGTYGWEIDQDAEVDAINQMLSDNTPQTRAPYYIQEAASTGTPDFGNTFIDLNLTSQHMYVIENGSVIFESDVVTGLPIAARITPDGVYDILDMQSPYTMHGDTDPATGEPAYVTTCSYWMRVTWTGVGFHDASWQSSFGGDRYTYAGSHGCINMPPSAAAELYGIIWVGIPVVSHY